jgi:glycosyltransferase involved in cell wall biosynthesis
MANSAHPLVSIVTPVYNEERYLAECIESILRQTYDNWEYTILDNCSTDATRAIAERYAATDRRIRVRHNEQFLTSIANCNEALRQISPSSKYCKVVFGDDWIFPECLERMVELAERHPTVGLVGAYALEGARVVLDGLSYETTVVPGHEACRRHLLERLYVFGTQTSVLYRADLVRAHDPLFNEANMHADTEADFAILRSSDFGFVHQVLSFTRIRDQSQNTLSQSMGTSWPALLLLLKRYGPWLFAPDQLQELLDEHLNGYYRCLGKSLLFRRDSSFWSYHLSHLQSLGLPYSRRRAVAGLLRALGHAALNPEQTLSALSKRRHRPHARGRRTDALAREGSPR